MEVDLDDSFAFLSRLMSILLEDFGCPGEIKADSPVALGEGFFTFKNW